MHDSEKLAVAAHLHVVMRRKMGRVTDIDWLMRSPEYARAIIDLACGQSEHVDVAEWGRKMQAALFPAPVRRAEAVTPPSQPSSHPPPTPASGLQRYVSGLR